MKKSKSSRSDALCQRSLVVLCLCVNDLNGPLAQVLRPFSWSALLDGKVIKIFCWECFERMKNVQGTVGAALQLVHIAFCRSRTGLGDFITPVGCRERAPASQMSPRPKSAGTAARATKMLKDDKSDGTRKHKHGLQARILKMKRYKLPDELA